MSDACGANSGGGGCARPLIEVVAAAIVQDGRVLAARRAYPPELAGGWEFPGGKVEPGEDERDALVRELAEELGVRIAVGERLGAVADGRIRLTLFAARVDGTPVAGDDHDELRWLGVQELDAVGWLPIDRDLLGAVAGHLGANPSPADP